MSNKEDQDLLPTISEADDALVDQAASHVQGFFKTLAAAGTNMSVMLIVARAPEIDGEAVNVVVRSNISERYWPAMFEDVLRRRQKLL